MNDKCNAANWCVSLRTPHSPLCRLHVKYPLAHSWETQNEWLIRVRRALKAEEKRQQQARDDAAAEESARDRDQQRAARR